YEKMVTRNFRFLFSHITPLSVFYPLSLHDALPICFRSHQVSNSRWSLRGSFHSVRKPAREQGQYTQLGCYALAHARASAFSAYIDRKSTRLNSSHLGISYAVFCLKKKKNILDSLMY